MNPLRNARLSPCKIQTVPMAVINSPTTLLTILIMTLNVRSICIPPSGRVSVGKKWLGHVARGVRRVHRPTSAQNHATIDLGPKIRIEQDVGITWSEHHF